MSSAQLSHRRIVIFVNLHVIDTAAFVLSLLRKLPLLMKTVSTKGRAPSRKANKSSHDTSDLLDIERDIKRLEKGKMKDG